MGDDLKEAKVEKQKSRRPTVGPIFDDNQVANRGDHQVVNMTNRSEFVYVNSGYVGSLNSVNEPRPTEVPGIVLEQYWACSRWPHGQRVLAIAVGVLLGAVISLVISLVLSGRSSDIIGGIFKDFKATQQ